MENLKYVEIAIEQVHSKTIQGGLQWRCDRDAISSSPTATINVRIRFEDHGPYSAVWESVCVTHPVGEGVTIIGNPAMSKARLYPVVAAGRTLDQVNEIFRRVLLEPRQQEFQAAMKKLCEEQLAAGDE